MALFLSGGPLFLIDKFDLNKNPLPTFLFQEHTLARRSIQPFRFKRVATESEK